LPQEKSRSSVPLLHPPSVRVLVTALVFPSLLQEDSLQLGLHHFLTTILPMPWFLLNSCSLLARVVVKLIHQQVITVLTWRNKVSCRLPESMVYCYTTRNLTITYFSTTEGIRKKRMQETESPRESTQWTIRSQNKTCTQNSALRCRVYCNRI